MPIYGWDASHFDGPLTTALLRQARAEGIQFFTHKIGEGTGYDDPGDLTALAAARDAGIPFLGGYHVVRSGWPAAGQAKWAIQLADRDEPWWRSWPAWCWQVDLERWSYDNVPATTGIAVANELRAQTGRPVLLYASRGQYGNALADWDGPLWNASYVVSGARTGLAALYPGDDWAPGWAAYSNRVPALLQYTSSATIAGLTTCDANAFRGTLTELSKLWKGETVANEADKAFSAPYTGNEPWVSGQSWMAKAVEKPLRDLTAALTDGRLASAMTAEQYADLKGSVLAALPTADDLVTALIARAAAK